MSAAATVGAVVSKPMPIEHDLPLGDGHGQIDCIERRVHHLDVGAGGPLLGERGARRRHADQIAERRQRHLGQACVGDGPIEIADGGDAHRTAGAGDQAHAVGQELPQAVPGDRHGVRTADLHVRQRAPAGDRRKLHGDGADIVGASRRPAPGASLIAGAGLRRRRSARRTWPAAPRASTSSRTVMAQPACTST